MVLRSGTEVPYHVVPLNRISRLNAEFAGFSRYHAVASLLRLYHLEAIEIKNKPPSKYLDEGGLWLHKRLNGGALWFFGSPLMSFAEKLNKTCPLSGILGQMCA